MNDTDPKIREEPDGTVTIMPDDFFDLVMIEYNRKMTALGVMLIFAVIAVVTTPLIVVIFVIEGIAG